ncbi:hypothetical protein NEIELOOT_01704 [Neisseria elongata subsp. glycolytica ATCC 29315]|uniref:Uncharacterized protein n=1 Tax=Neisseria elongata subsp. glycolytica ATCC 29315 TaxID=546263 RepID=D4DRL1_NEIEG|nr:hypothetical protein NEIELOOT_01704 [Neisseria elongata subsp. glycolytica ATCC 29315]
MEKIQISFKTAASYQIYKLTRKECTQNKFYSFMFYSFIVGGLEK